MARPRSRWGRPLAERRGTFLILTVVGIFVLLGFTALVADFGYVYADRQRIQGVLDMAGLSTLMTTPGIDDTSATTSVNQILTANGVDPADVTLIDVTQDGDGVNLRINATVPMNSLFGGLFGTNSYSVALTSFTSAVIKLPVPLLEGFGLFACSQLTINNTMGSYDSEAGPDSGPPTGIPMAGCSQAGTNCGDNLLIGSNGDVIFEGATVYGNVAAGGSVLHKSKGGAVTGDVRVGTSTVSGSVTVHGSTFLNQPFPAIDCDEDAHFPDHFLDHGGTGNHFHGGVLYSEMREIEEEQFDGDEAAPDGEDDEGFAVTTFDGTVKTYILGNRLGDGIGTEDVIGAGNEDVLFHSVHDHTVFPPAPPYGNETASGKWPMTPSHAADPNFGGSSKFAWEWTPSTEVAYFKTGVVYFFHTVKFAGNRDHYFVGDLEAEGPAVFFIHGNGVSEGGTDFKANNANFKYAGACGGALCGNDEDIPGLRIYATDETVMDMAGNYELSVDITAPGALVDMTGTSGVLGRILADVIDMSGNSDFSFDQRLQQGSPDQPFEPEIIAARIIE